jgi:hypothetical protein
MSELAFSKKHQDAIDHKQFQNLRSKQMDGGVLSSAELKFIAEYMVKYGDETIRDFGTYAKNQSELADKIGVNRKTIQRWRKEPNFPKPKPDGRWNIKEVVIWKDTYGARGGDLTSKESEQMRSIMLQNEKLEIQVGILRGEYTPNVDIDQQVSEMVQQSKRELLALPASLAPQVIGQSIAEAEKIIKQAIIESLKSLHENQWQKDGKE